MQALSLARSRIGGLGARSVGFHPLLHCPATPTPHTMAATPPESLVDCSKVFVKNDAYGGAGAFAACDIAKGDMVEKGIVRVLTNIDGNENPYVFTWSDEMPNVTWACGSGCSTFYNTSEEEASNTHMVRDFAGCSFVISATKDIKAGDELLHVYKSKKWRTCFKDDLNPPSATEEAVPPEFPMSKEALDEAAVKMILDKATELEMPLSEEQTASLKAFFAGAEVEGEVTKEVYEEKVVALAALDKEGLAGMLQMIAAMSAM